MKRFALFLPAVLSMFTPAMLPAKSPRIMGGTPAPEGDYPFMTAVVRKSVADNFNAQFAGASLIHPRWVLTAGHIVEGLKAADMQVIVGPTDLDAAGLQRVNVLEIVRHQKYVRTGFDFDAALLLLETPVTNVTPVEIIADPALAAAGLPATVLGWGSQTEDENDFGTPILQSVEVPIVDQELANSASYHAGALTDNMMAAGVAEGGKDSCGGDSGGPLLVRGSRGQWVQAGIVSWGEGCGDPTKPGVYTRLSKFRQWVQSFVWPDFYAWEVANSITTDDGPDRDSDGMTQWQEYALGQNPLLAFDAPALLQAGRDVQPEHLYPTLTLRRPAGGGNLAWSLQSSANLQTWAVLNAVTQQTGVVAVPGNPALEDVTWRGQDGTPSSYLRALAAPGTDYYSGKRTLSFPGGVTHVLHTGDVLSGGFRARDYLLTTLPEGQSVTLTLRSTAFNSVLQLLNADTGAVLTNSTNNSGGGGSDEKITFTVAAGTHYAARVTNQVAGAVGEFTLAVFQLKTTGVTTITGTQSLSGALSTSDFQDPFYPDGIYYADDFRFTAPDTTPVTVFMTSSNFATFVEVINAETGDQLLASSGSQSQGGFSKSAMQTFIPTTGVTYYLRMSSTQPQKTGAYAVRTLGAAKLTVGQTFNGAFATTDGLDPYWLPDYEILADDYVLTNAPAGVARTIAAASPVSQLDMVLEVLDAATGESVAFSDDLDETTTDPEIVFTPEAGHSYIIRVSAYDELDTGDYVVQVN